MKPTFRALSALTLFAVAVTIAGLVISAQVPPPGGQTPPPPPGQAPPPQRAPIQPPPVAPVPPPPPAPASGPLTTAESTNYIATSTCAEVLAFIRDLQKLSPLVRVESIATTAEGRDVPLLVIGKPLPRDPLALRYDKRAVVYIQANIHAGEVEGKEASLMLARDIVLDPKLPYLDKVVLLVAPVFNADGNDKMDPRNRMGHHTISSKYTKCKRCIDNIPFCGIGMDILCTIFAIFIRACVFEVVRYSLIKVIIPSKVTITYYF